MTTDFNADYDRGVTMMEALTNASPEDRILWAAWSSIGKAWGSTQLADQENAIAFIRDVETTWLSAILDGHPTPSTIAEMVRTKSGEVWPVMISATRIEAEQHKLVLSLLSGGDDLNPTDLIERLLGLDED